MRAGQRTGEARPGRDLIEAALRAGASSLDEQAGKALFAAYGIPVPPSATVSSSDEAVRAAREIGFPVVLKGSAPEVQHKTDAGLVILGLADETEVREAYRSLTARATAVHTPASLSAESRRVWTNRSTRWVSSVVAGRASAACHRAGASCCTCATTWSGGAAVAATGAAGACAAASRRATVLNEGRLPVRATISRQTGRRPGRRCWAARSF